jgi:hypothetical protein
MRRSQMKPPADGRCACGCGRELVGRAALASAACRKRVQRQMQREFQRQMYKGFRSWSAAVESKVADGVLTEKDKGAASTLNLRQRS